MSEIEFWFLSLRSSVSRSVRRWMRSISSGALLSNAPRPPELAGTTGQPCGPCCVIGRAPFTAPASWISLTPVKPTPLICRGRALEHRRFAIDFDAHPDEFRPIRKQRNLADLPDGNTGEADVRTLVEPADALGEVNVVTFVRAVVQARDPDGEQQQARDHRERHGADHHIVRPRFHQASRVLLSRIRCGPTTRPVEVFLDPRMIQSQ